MKHEDLQRSLVRLQLQKALAGVMHELEKCEAGQPAVDSEQRLRFISQKLTELIEVLEREDDLEGKHEVPGLWRIVTDTWPYRNPLRTIIVEAELEYERLIKGKL